MRPKFPPLQEAAQDPSAGAQDREQDNPAIPEPRSLPSQWTPAGQLPRPPSQMLKCLSPAPCLISGAR